MLRQRTADTGWSFEALLYPREGNPISLGIPVIDGYTLLAAQLEHASGDGYHWRPPAYVLLAKTVRETVLGR